jgi:para-aminobenzoate synthetase component 1
MAIVSPFDVAAAYRDRDHFAFLDSSQADREQGRYSILGWDPQVVFRSKSRLVDIRSNGRWSRTEEDPIQALERLFEGWGPDSPRSGRFGGGAIGYFGYDLFRYLEGHGTTSAFDDLNLPDCCVAIYDNLRVYDHLTGEWNMNVTVPTAISTPKKTEEKQQPVPPESNMTYAQYLSAVRKALDYIAAGDVYQVNLSQRFCHSVDAAPFDIFTRLRSANPSHYGAYLNYGDHTVISASPELFLKREGTTIETRPIKGTRPRGHTPVEDTTLRNELLGSEKDAAELAMIVDLERNDLGRVCEYGSVEVTEHRTVDELPTLFHTVSTVRGKLRERTSIVDILRATFPGGSISGCPKIRAIQIIDELEPTRRHVYTGAIGFIGFNGDLRLNVAIRTMTAVGDRVYYQVGGGIVADSVPEKEYAETLHKAAALENAITRTSNAPASR